MPRGNQGPTHALTLKQSMNVMKRGQAEFNKYRVDSERWIRFIQTCYIQQPDLLECDPRRVALCFLNACALKLEPNGRHFVVVSFANRKRGGRDPQLIVMYHGLVDLVYRTKMIQHCESHVVYEGDKFDFEYGSRQFISHRPTFDPDGKMLYAWSRITTTTGGEIIRVMDAPSIERIRSISASSNNADSPWKKHPDQMWQKTVFKQACKWAPSNPDLDAAIVLDDAAEAQLPQHVALNAVHSEDAFDDAPLEELAVDPDASKSERLSDDLKRQQQHADAEPASSDENAEPPEDWRNEP